MSQSKVTAYYSARKNAKSSQLSKTGNIIPEEVVKKSKTKNAKTSKTVSQQKLSKLLCCANTKTDEVAPKKKEPKISTKETVQMTKTSSHAIVSDCHKVEKTKVGKVTTEIQEECSEPHVNSVSSVPLSPKRKLPGPCKGSPSKRKPEMQKDCAKQKDAPKHAIKAPRTLVLTTSQQHVEAPTETIKISASDKSKEVMETKRSEETMKAIAEFKERMAKLRRMEANNCKVTSVIGESGKTCSLPTVPAYQKYHHLVEPEVSSSLILPFKYKVLAEMFRSMDTVISILSNRKETVTFEKVKEGVQKMMKKNFSKEHLGQIITVMPSSYEVTLQKIAFKKATDPHYQLILSPVLTNVEVKGKETITPQIMLERRNTFNQLLLNLVKDHHTTFLKTRKFPSVPPETSIKRWHPKFPVDSVPDIAVASLPEVPEAKVYSAKDVLNKVVKGSLRGKVVKALKGVAEESSTSNTKIELKQTNNKSEEKQALKGVCSDLIAKIRERESAKLLQCMTQSPGEVKRKSMLERLPKMVQIIWHYFIAERKAAVPVDTAVEKIIHSYNSLLTHDEVKDHLKLIVETFPGWLSFIQIPKGVYITMNKNKNITEMLDNFNCG